MLRLSFWLSIVFRELGETIDKRVENWADINMTALIYFMGGSTSFGGEMVVDRPLLCVKEAVGGAVSFFYVFIE